MYFSSKELLSTFLYLRMFFLFKVKVRDFRFFYESKTATTVNFFSAGLLNDYFMILRAAAGVSNPTMLTLNSQKIGDNEASFLFQTSICKSVICE